MINQHQHQYLVQREDHSGLKVFLSGPKLEIPAATYLASDILGHNDDDNGNGDNTLQCIGDENRMSCNMMHW